MVAIEVRFPLGTYHAVSSASFGTPEWPPHPVRLIGALLAAAHDAPGIDTDAARAAIQRLAEATPPVIVAGGDLPHLRGATRWAPRNHAAGELSKGVSPRDVSRGRTAVHKGGVVVGQHPVAFWWQDVDLDAASARVLDDLVAELSFLGTSRSPVIGRVHTDAPTDAPDRWEPVLDDADAGDARVRVPDETLLHAFDVRHEARRAPGHKPVASDHVPVVAIGRTVPYALRSLRRQRSERTTVEPRHWSDMLILALDPGDDPGGSELRPKAPAAYLLARAFRAALLGAYATPGMPEDAPPILRGRGADPHVAIVPLPYVGDVLRSVRRPDGTVVERAIAADGVIRGIAVVFPHESRVPDLAEQRLRVEAGLRTFVLGGDRRRWVDVPGAGRVLLRLPAPGRAVLRTLSEDRYRGPSRTWESVIPVVHSRHRTSKGPSGVRRQVAADCRDAGLPDPEHVEILDLPTIGGAAARLALAGLPADHAWRDLVRGHRSHVRITFAQPVAGPVLLGRARHFGSGLCVPVPEGSSDA